MGARSWVLAGNPLRSSQCRRQHLSQRLVPDELNAVLAGLSVDTESVGWIDTDGRLFMRSEAALHVAVNLGGAWRLAAATRIAPQRLRDAVYDLVATRRYRIMPQACFIPTADGRGRFLQGDAAVRWISGSPAAP
jgi:predicted DCC family thiol-disulfide oxidoreductase YuxK